MSSVRCDVPSESASSDPPFSPSYPLSFSRESYSSSSSQGSNTWSAAAGHIYGARVARSITSGNLPEPETYNHVSVLFMDMIEYKDMVYNCEMSRMSKWMENVHTIIDGAIADHCVRKVETRGDAYILVAGQ